VKPPNSEIAGNYRQRIDLTATLTGLAGLAGGLTGASTASAPPLPNGTAYSWGANFDGQLGDGTTTQRSAPVLVQLPAGTYTAVAAGEFHGLALTSAGNVYAWGGNQSGQLGDGTTTDRTSPVFVHLPAGAHAVSVAGGDIYTLAVTCDGRVLG
jgi:alpha-tubulin suppressor-like RCC1 family protein